MFKGYKILLLSLVFFSFSALFFTPRFVFAASASFSSSQNISVGQNFPVYMVVSTESSKPLNAVSALVYFPKDKLELVSISKSGSIINFWAEEPRVNNTDGTATIEGIVLNPGWSGNSGRVVTLNFRAKLSGAALIQFSNASILANDGAGTNILTSSTPLPVTIGIETPEAVLTGLPLPVVKSSTHPSQNFWYKSNSPEFSWDLPKDVTKVRLLYNKTQDSVPTVEYSPAISKKQLDKLSDGVYYLHVQYGGDAGWGPVAHFKFQIDSAPPNDFDISLAHKENRSDQRPILYFNTTDSVSGVDYYTVKIGNDKFITVDAKEVDSNPYAPSKMNPGENKVVVIAYDKAGNSLSKEQDIKIESIDPPIVESYEDAIAEGDLFRVRGKSYVDSVVTVYLKDEDGIVTTETGRANSLGNFSVLWTKRLPVGKYSFMADVTDNKGARSYPTETYYLKVGKSGISKYSSVFANYLSLVIIGLLILGSIIALALYIIHRLRRFHSNLSKKFAVTERAIHHDFDLLKDELTEEIAKLEKAKSKRSLTAEEKSFINKLKKYIDVVEEDVNKKLSSLEDDID